jgi:hypothetical protein
MRTVPKQQDPHFSTLLTCAAHGLHKGAGRDWAFSGDSGVMLVADGRRGKKGHTHSKLRWRESRNQRRVGFGLIEKASVVDNVTFLGHGWNGRRLLRGMRTA